MTDNSWSVSETELLNAVGDLLASDREGVLATVIRVEGSAYRRPGAKMVVTADGEGIGAITAGCLEEEVHDLAREVLDAGRPRVERYDLMEDDDDVWGLGVGCNGVIDVLLEPLDESYRPALAAFERGDDVAVMTTVGGSDPGPGAGADQGTDEAAGAVDPDADPDGLPMGARAYRTDDGFEAVDGTFPDWLADALAGPAAELAGSGRADTLTIERPDGGTARVFVDGVRAPPEFVVFGSGHDLGPVVELAKHNDFRVTVVGFRGGVDLAERFPLADDTVTTSPADVGDLALDAETYTVVATHNFIDDRLTVEELVRSEVPYVGLMGPHERFEEMLADFREEGRSLSEAELEAVYTPVGLDLGGGAPYQIATSIVAEALAVHNGRDPGHLRDREGHIHDRVEVDVEAPATD